MKSLKLKICLIMALALTMIATLGTYLGMTVLKALANRYVTLSGTSIFVTSGGADIWAHRVDEYDDEGELIEDEDYDYYFYTMFVFQNDSDTVSFRRNLAYSWYYNLSDLEDSYRDEPYEGENGNWWVREEDTGIEYDADVTPTVSENDTWVFGEEDSNVKVMKEAVPQAAEGYFHMEIGFEEVNFERYIIKFETQQFNMTEDKVTANYVVFLPEMNDGEPTGKVVVFVTDDEKCADAEEEIAYPESAVALKADNIVIAFDKGEASGEYLVNIYNSGAEEICEQGIFKNVGKTYAKYVSSSTNPVTPLTFSAVFGEEKDGRVRMALYEMNGQSFALNRNLEGETVSTSRSISKVDDHYTGGQVNDTTPPVLCLDSGISYVTDGNELSFSFTAVDVLTQSPSTSTGYLMLTYDQQSDPNFDPNDYNAKGVYRVVTSDTDQFMFPHASHYLPVYGIDYNVGGYGTAFNNGEDSSFTPVAALKIYIKLTDTSSTGGQSTYVFLDWFVEDQFKLHIGDYDYIAVSTDDEGATYNYGESTEEWQALIAEYQAKVDEATKNIKAGADDFYLPSLEDLITDNSTKYEDMTFSIYYMANGTRSSSTNKSASSLSFALNAAGDYLFTVYAMDASSNSMWYLKDGEKVEFTASDIWTMYEDEDEEGLHDLLPWFTFRAGVAEISVEDPGEQDTAYVGTSYTGKAFDIEGVSTSATYSLYLFDNAAYYADNKVVLTYAEFMDRKQELFENPETRRYYKEIPAVSRLDENDDDYEKLSAYNWNPTSRSFVPQDENSFYLIKCTVTSTQIESDPVYAYMGIAASIPPASVAGEDTWVEDNMVSIILLSIAGAAFIGIILLLVIKPKDKGDIDVQFEAETATKSKKNK